MPRPPKWRRVEYEPQVKYFKPAGIPKYLLEELILNVEEVEAIRLKDLEGLEQEECAEKMNVSRPTFQRILVAARSKLADAIIKGKAIRVEGGKYLLADNWQNCKECGFQYRKVCDEQEYVNKAESCPKCGKDVEKEEV